MSRPILIIVFLSFYIPAYCAAADYSKQWQKGVSFYGQKQYDSAAFYFEQIAATKPQNADVYYNLGNAYYKLNKVALSILNYERALRIDPENKAAKENLALAQGRISNLIHQENDIFFITWWQNITRPQKATMWAILSLVSFTLIISFILMRRYSTSRALPVQLPGIFAFICICMLVLAFAAARRSQQHNSAVVMENDAPMMNDQLKGKPLALIPEGTTVRIREEKGTWIQISLPDGRTGWLQQAMLEKI